MQQQVSDIPASFQTKRRFGRLLRPFAAPITEIIAKPPATSDRL